MTIELTTSQAEADYAFRLWADALIAHSTLQSYGWTIEGRGVVFNNYSHGAPGEILDQVMLGADPLTGSGIVKIVKPDASQRDKGKRTVVGRDELGRTLLLREGKLQKNNLSRAITDDFTSLTRLSAIPVTSGGRLSDRLYFLVADLSATPSTIVAQTAEFALACAQARSLAGGASVAPQESKPYAFALDEKGHVRTVTREASVTEVCALHAYVSEALKAELGDTFERPTNGGYTVDGVIASAELLIEIKTGVFAHDIYEAVGQLRLYPSLVNLPKSLDPVLVIPDVPALRPALAAAVSATNIEVYTYSVGQEGEKPKIVFSDALLERCRTPKRSQN